MDPLEFYKLDQEPFSNAPVSRFYYESQQSRDVLERLKRSVDLMKGLAVVVGEVGSGKTTLARRLLNTLPDKEYEAALLVIIHSKIDPDWLVKRIAQQLGVEQPKEKKVDLLGQLYQRLLEIHEEGKKAVVLIDEAQMLGSREMMEELRGIMNLEIPEKKLITFVLFGLSDLNDCLKLDPPLLQRVAQKLKLEPFAKANVQAYVEHRLKLAGAKQEVFSQDAIKKIYEYSGGVPRLINTIADNALFEGTLVSQNPISEKIIIRVSQDLGLEKFSLSDFQKWEKSDPNDFSKENKAFDDLQMPSPSEEDVEILASQSVDFDVVHPVHVSHKEKELDEQGIQLGDDENKFLREDRTDNDLDNVDDLLSNLDEKP